MRSFVTQEPGAGSPADRRATQTETKPAAGARAVNGAFSDICALVAAFTEILLQDEAPDVPIGSHCTKPSIFAIPRLNDRKVTQRVSKGITAIASTFLTYATLEVQSGDVAQVAWMEMPITNDDSRRLSLADSLEAYCALDTLAMVRIYQVLVEQLRAIGFVFLKKIRPVVPEEDAPTRIKLDAAFYMNDNGTLDSSYWRLCMTESMKKCLLLVEDEAILAMTEKLRLEEYGYTVRIVTTGEKAVEAVETSSDIDLILMDINLGDGIDGTQAAEIILKDHDIPIVFLSSHTEPEIVEKTEEITSYGYVVKNSSVAVLVASIKMAFRLSETRRLADDTFTHSINGLCVHRLIRDESGNLHDCEYLRVNGSFARHTGLFSQNIVGRTIRDLYPGPDADDVIRLYDEVLSGRADAQQEIYFKPTQTWYEISVFRTQEDEFTVVVHNITKRKRFEEELLRNRDLLERTQLLARIGGWVWDTESQTMTWTDETYRIHGMTPGEFAPGTPEHIKASLACYDAADRTVIEAAFGLCAATGQRYDLEFPLTRIDGSRIWIRTMADAEKQGDRVVRVFGNIIDITERKQAEENLQKSEHRFRSFIENANDIVYAASPDGLLTYVSPNWLEFMGEPEEEVIGKSFEKYVHPEDAHLCREFLEKVLTTGQKQGSVEYRVRHKDGSWRRHVSNGSPLRDSDGNVTEYIGIARDVTANYERREELRQSEKKLRQVIDLVPHFIFAKDVNGKYLLANKAVAEVYGTTPEELVGKSDYDFSSNKEETDFFLECDRRVIVSGTGLYNIEEPITDSTGARRYLETTKIPFTTSGTEIPAILAVSVDVTARKQFEQELISQKQYLETVLESAADGFWVVTPDKKITNVNAAYSRMSGYSKAELERMAINDLDAIESPQETAERVKRIIENGSETFETRHRRNDGSLFDVEVSASRFHRSDGIYLVCFCRDITERKRTDTNLTESVKLLSQAQKIAHIGNWHLDLTANRLRWSDEIYRIFGCEPQEFAATYEAFLDLVHPDDRAAVDSAYTRSVQEGNNGYEIEHRIVPRDSGGVRYVHERCDHERDDTGTIIRSIGMVQDITQRKQAEEELHKAKSDYHAITNLTGDIIVQVDAEGHWTFLNDIALSFWGGGQEELLRHSFSDFLHPEDQEETTSAFMKMIETGEAQRKLINRQMTPEGWRVVQWNGLPMYDNGEYVGFQATGRDITEQNLWKEALENERRRLAAIIEGTNVGTWEWNVQTGETVFNERWASIIGYTLEEISPVSIETWQRFTNADDLKRSEQLLHAHFSGDTEMYEIEVQMHHRAGHWVWVLDRGKVATWTEDGQPEWVFGTHQEVTERIQAEKEIQKQLTEKEVLLREVHHRVKNNVANIEGLLSLQAGSTADTEVKIALQEAISRVQSMRVLYDKLLLNKDLNEISIKDYAEDLLGSLVMAFDPENNITIEKHITDFEIDAKKAFTIGIILNELLTNIFKYAFGDREDGLVTVSIDKEESTMTLIIQDNGSGFDERALENKSPGFGLTVVKMLVEQLGGTYSLSNDNGARTVVRFEV